MTEPIYRNVDCCRRPWCKQRRWNRRVAAAYLLCAARGHAQYGVSACGVCSADMRAALSGKAREQAHQKGS